MRLATKCRRNQLVSHYWLPSYNPDWAVVIEKDDVERLYFVVETKGSLFTDALRPAEQAKIDCGLAHFDALGDNVQFIKATEMKDVEDHMSLLL